MSRTVVALGGNALGNTPEEQQNTVERVAKTIVSLIQEGAQVVLTHGNGPQVGMISSAFEECAGRDPAIPLMPLAESTAMSEGYIGYHLQKALCNEFAACKLDKTAVSLVTQVEVFKDDGAFLHPTKPIGAFYSAAEAARYAATHPGSVIKEDAGRGFRRMVASPAPHHIVEIGAIKALMNSGTVVIACGGGGIPVAQNENGALYGVEAVIDKDSAAERLAEELDAELLLILTAVDRVCLNYGTPHQQPLEHISVADAARYCREGHFAPGSMLPKVEAAIAFAESRPGRRAIIASPQNAAKALRGNAGTSIEALPAPVAF